MPMRWIVPTLLAVLLSGQASDARQPQAPGSGGAEAAHAGRSRKTHVRRTVVRVQDVDNPARNAFQHSFDLDFDGPPGAESVFAVPKGDRLVIDFVTIEARGAASAVMSCSITTSAKGEPAKLFLGLTGTFRASATETLHGVTQPVRAYADGGTDVTTACVREGDPTATTRAQVTIVGHLVGQ
jgi:hypothetical protein